MQGADDEPWMWRVYSDLDNARAAIAWGLDREEPDDNALAVRVLVGLAWFAQGNRSTSLDSLAMRAVDMVENTPRQWRATILALGCQHELNQGRPARALELGRLAMRDGIATEAVYSFLPHQNLIFAELMVGARDRAEALLDEGLLAFANTDPYTQGNFLATSGTFLALLGRDDEARTAAERAVELARSIGSRTLLVQSLSAAAWALQRSEPEAALQRIDELFDVAGDAPWYSGAEGTATALAGGLRARLGDLEGAFRLLHRAALVTRDEGVRPQFAAVLDWSVLALLRVGRPDTAVVLLGTLTEGVLADVSNYLLTGSYSREQALDRIRPLVGPEFDALVARGGAMTYDEIVAYALEELSAERA
jgi:tetratricopeptide (TPR) repeat protein